MFLASKAAITIYGGSAGGGKTFGALLDATQGVENSEYGAVIFRRTMKQVKDEGGIWDKSASLYPSVNAKPNLTERYWTFPSGAVVQFAGLENETSKYDYQGAEICKILFEELTHFTEGQFFYLLSRNRSTSGIEPSVKATCNPEPGWVKRLLAPWVDRKFPDPAKSGEIRHFVREHDQIVWVPAPPDRGECNDGPNGERCLSDGCLKCFPPEKSITFIRATVYDNRELLKVNPEYISNLKALDDVERRRLLDGDWDALPPNRVIDAFDESIHVVSTRKNPKDWNRFVGADFGLINAAEVILEQDPHAGTLYIGGEDWPGHSRSFDAIAAKIRELAGCTPVEGAGGNRTTEQGWRQAMRSAGIPMAEPIPEHSDPKLQYKCVNDAFRDGKLFVMDCCPKTVQMLNEFQRKIDSRTGEVTDDFDDSTFHLLAALRYIVVKLLPPKPLETFTGGVILDAPQTITPYAYPSQAPDWNISGRFSQSGQW